MTGFTAAIVQQPTAVLDLKEGVARAVRHIKEAGKADVRLVVFPETWLTGYPAWVFGMAGWDDAEARHWYGRFLDECTTAEGEALLPIRQAAREAGAIVALGFNEKLRPAAGTAYNSILLIGADGATLNIHRKLTPTHTEKNIWGQGDASGLRVVDTPHGRIGGLVCWEHWHPLMRQAMHMQDEQLHVACWPDMPESHGIASRHYAFEGRCFVAAAAQFLTVADVPDALLGAYRAGLGAEAASGGILLPGGSAFARPDGSWMAPQLYDEPGLVIAEIDLAETKQYKHDLDVVGHYSRPDVFQLTVDRSARASVKWLSDDMQRASGDTERATDRPGSAALRVIGAQER